jgi:uncharacterized RDD family membrane protein YckC
VRTLRPLPGERGLAPVEKHLLRTPEGVPLQFQIARVGDRAAAFVLDMFFLLLILVLLVLLTVVVLAGTDGSWSGWLVALLVLVLFLVQSFYFVFAEARGRGTTPGKRRIGIRVVDRRGGRLDIDAIVVRNIVRNIEVFLPMAILIAPAAVWPGTSGWMRLLGSVWVIVLLLFPLFNRDRLRIGDLLAGTMVVRAPRAVLLEDVGAKARKAQGRAAAYAFTEAQLSVYGEYELHVLEDLLRRRREDYAYDAQQAVARRIAKKIEWPGEVPPLEAAAFLDAYYRALRGRLERRMLFGTRKADKHAREERIED